MPGMYGIILGFNVVFETSGPNGKRLDNIIVLSCSDSETINFMGVCGLGFCFGYLKKT